MKNSLSLDQITDPIVKAFKKFHFTLFLVIIVGGVAYGVFTMNNILATSSQANGYTSTLAPTNFNQTTINEVNTLQTSSQATSNVTLPAGRINPFSE